MKKKRAAATIAACAAALALMVGGTMAYLTDTETTTNTFTVGKVSIDLQEPNYPGNGSDETTDIVPGEEIPKDPSVKNTGKNTAVVFTRVNIPMKNVITANEDGTRVNGGAAQNTELFLFKNDEGGSYNSVNSNWIELSTTYLNDKGEVVEKDSATMCSRLYGYKHVLGVDETTKPVFSTVKFANLIEGQDDEASEDIDIYSYAIQASNIAGVTDSGTTNYEFTFEGMSDEDIKTKLGDIYKVYINQEDSVDGTGNYDVKANVNGSEKIDNADSTPSQTLKNSTLNVTMSVANRHLKLNSGDDKNKSTTFTTTVNYVGDGTKPSVTYEYDTSVISLDEANGTITALKAGTTTIKATATNPDSGKDVTASVTVQVTDQNTASTPQ